MGTWKVDHADDRWCGVPSRTRGTLLPTSLYVYKIKCYAIVTRCHRGSGLLNAGLAYRTPQGVWVFFYCQVIKHGIFTFRRDHTDRACTFVHELC